VAGCCERLGETTQATEVCTRCNFLMLVDDGDDDDDDDDGGVLRSSICFTLRWFPAPTDTSSMAASTNHVYEHGMLG